MDACRGFADDLRGPDNTTPSNRSRKRFRFPAPLGPGPFRGPFFCPGRTAGIGGEQLAGYSWFMAHHLPPADAPRIIRGIMLAVLVWGSLLAAGAWTFNHDIRRPIVVMVCVLGFLGFWGAMLSARRRRLDRPSDTRRV